MTQAAEFYAMSPEELESRLVESRRELLNLRFQLATGQLDNTAQIRTIRRDVARVLTVLREMEIAEAEGVAFEPPAPKPEQVQARRRAAEREAAALETEEIDVQIDDEEAETAAPRRRSRRSAPTGETAPESAVVEPVADEVAEPVDAAPEELEEDRAEEPEDLALEVPEEPLALELEEPVAELPAQRAVEDETPVPIEVEEVPEVEPAAPARRGLRRRAAAGEATEQPSRIRRGRSRRAGADEPAENDEEQ